MSFKSEYIKNEISRLQKLLDNDNKYKREFLKNKQKLNGLITNSNENNLLDKICQQNLFEFCGFKEYGRRCEINDLISGYIAFVSNSGEEAERRKAYYIKECGIDILKENDRNTNEGFIKEIIFKEELWGKVIFSNRDDKYYLYIYKTNKIDDENYYLRFNCVDFISFILKKTCEETKRLLVSIMGINTNEELKNLLDVYNKNIYVLANEIWRFDYLNRFIYKYIEILKQLIDLVKSDVYKLNKINDKYYLYCASSYFAKKINVKDTTARNYLHIFTALELVDKVVNEKDNTGMYYIKEFTKDVLDNANIIAKKFMDNKISVAKFNKKNSLTLFGEEKTNLIFTEKVITKKL